MYEESATTSQQVGMYSRSKVSAALCNSLWASAPMQPCCRGAATLAAAAAAKAEEVIGDRTVEHTRLHDLQGDLSSKTRLRIF